MFNPFSAPFSIIKYVITDQEADGRQAGIKAAAECYAPILMNLENRQSNLKRKLKNEADDFNRQCSYFIDECEYYDMEIKEYTHKIEELRKNNAQISSRLSTMGWGAGTATALLSSSGAAGPLVPISWAGSGGAALGLAGLATPLAGIVAAGLIGDFLEKKMEKKYQKYLKIAFEEASKAWQKKIEEKKKEVRSQIKDLRKLRMGNRHDLDDLEHSVQEYMDRYATVKIIYSAVKDMR